MNQTGTEKPSAKNQKPLVVVGLILFLGSLATIVICLINHFSNQSVINRHPLETLFSNGANLSKYDYTFLPPWTGFEVFVLLALIVGLLIVIFADYPKE